VVTAGDGATTRTYTLSFTTSAAPTADSEVSPDRAIFHKKYPLDITVALKYNDNILINLKNDTYILKENIDFSVNGDEVVIKSDTLAVLCADTQELVFTFGMSGGASPTLTVAILGDGEGDPPLETALPVSIPLSGEAVETGVKLVYGPVAGAAGYRIYRSAQGGALGASLTVKPVTAASFVDVNVDAQKTYYYTVRAVMADTGPLVGGEQLQGTSAQVAVTTGAKILGGNASDMPEGKEKNFILMQIDNPMMSVNGIAGEVDPGRGTTPVERNWRTLMPIRSVVENMGGTVGWDEETRKVTLGAGGSEVVMWLGNNNFTVDGQSKEMDVAPDTINGRTMVPVRFVAESTGCVVDWLSRTSEIVVVFYTGQ